MKVFQAELDDTSRRISTLEGDLDNQIAWYWNLKKEKAHKDVGDKRLDQKIEQLLRDIGPSLWG